MPDSPARAYAREVLARPEFQAPSSRFHLEDWIPQHLPSALGWAIFALLVVAIVSIALRALENRGGILKAARTNPRKPGLAEILQGEAVTQEAALAIARRAADEGNLRQALWIGHRLLLHSLNDAGALSFRPWKTNGTYLSECATGHSQYPLLREFTEHYEQVIYRHNRVEPALVLSLLERLQRGLTL